MNISAVESELPRESESLWGKAWYKFSRDRMGMASLVIVGLFMLIAIGVWLGLWGQGWSDNTGPMWAKPGAEHWLGTNIIGQDIYRARHLQHQDRLRGGLVVAVLSTIVGAIFGALAGYFNNTWIDEVILWLKGVLDSIPFYLFVAAIAFALQGYAYSMHMAMIATFWTTTGRLVRGEVIKLKNFEFVEAARAIGLPQSKSSSATSCPTPSTSCWCRPPSCSWAPSSPRSSSASSAWA